MSGARSVSALFSTLCLVYLLKEIIPQISQTGSLRVERGSCLENSTAVSLNFVFLLYTSNDKFQIPHRSRVNFLKMLSLCLESIRRSQNSAKIHVGIPEHEVADWSMALTGKPVNVISIQVQPPAYESWVYKVPFYQKVLLQTDLKDVENIVWAEPDQLYWADISSIFTSNFDVGVTFTKRRSSRKADCLNSGVIFIKKVSEPIIKLWERYAVKTREVCKKYGCRIGGENQRALCDVLGGPGTKNENRTIRDRIIVLGLDKDSYNMFTPTSCSRASPNVYMTHFKGAKKRYMFREKCRMQYIQSSALSTKPSRTIGLDEVAQKKC